ncbi:MAG: cysteine hydrolase [Saccharofermentans sp.]|nr:cysteine hydrolase [Clostridiales bacterium]MCR4766575.1 cysteine hydrolase [Saccharofermentans sp.]
MYKLLIVVDMQKDFVDGALGFEGADRIIPGIIEKIKEFEAEGGQIVYTLDTHFENYMETQEGKNLPVPHCLKGSEGHGLCEELKPLLSGRKVFEKPCFGSIELAEYIKENASDISSIELCGLVSNICVLSNAVIAKAAAPEAEVIVNSALTASFDPKLHQATLDVLKGIQVTVV